MMGGWAIFGEQNWPDTRPAARAGETLPSQLRGWQTVLARTPPMPGERVPEDTDSRLSTAQ